MRKPASMKALEELGRVRLSPNFFMREMLYSEISNFHGIPNIPDDPDLAIAVGTRLCEELLEPLHATFGRVSIRSAFRSVAINDYGHERKNYNCGGTTWNHSRHVWDRRDEQGLHGRDRVHHDSVVPRTPRTGSVLGGHGLVDTRPPAIFRHCVFFNLGLQSALARKAEPAHHKQHASEGMSHEAKHGEPCGRPFLGVCRLSGTET